MADKVQFELVSPEKLLLSEAVDMVVVPGSEGNFGVLPGHSLLISTVRPGFIDVYDGAVISERIFVSGGFAEVFTGSPGKLVGLEDTIKGFKGIVAGDYDDLPESAFYMVGPIEEAVEKARKMAAEAA